MNCFNSRSRDSASRSASAFALSRSLLLDTACVLLVLSATLLLLERALANEAVDATLAFGGVALAPALLPRMLSSGLAPPEVLLELLARIAGLRAAGDAAPPRIAGLNPGAGAPAPRVAGLDEAPPTPGPTPCSMADALSAVSSSCSSNVRGPEPSLLGCCHMRKKTATCGPPALESLQLAASVRQASAEYTRSWLPARGRARASRSTRESAALPLLSPCTGHTSAATKKAPGVGG